MTVAGGAGGGAHLTAAGRGAERESSSRAANLVGLMTKFNPVECNSSYGFTAAP
jgi:hypothetical protein